VSGQALLANSSVVPQVNADVLQFSVRDRDSAVATRLTNAYAGAFVQYKVDLATAALIRARNELDSRIKRLEATGETTSDLYRTLVRNEQQLRTMQLLEARDAVLPSIGTAAQVAPTPKRTAFFGAILGFVAGLALALLWEALDTRLRSAKQIEDVLNLPLLARLPEPPRHLRSSDRLVMIEEPTSLHAEVVQILRSNFEVVNAAIAARTVMVTSCAQREGKSTTVANLAVALARSGKNVALVDLDLREPIIARFFNLPADVGITDVVRGNVPLKQAMGSVRVSSSHRLSVLPIGRRPENPGEFASSDALKEVLGQLRSTYDLVLVDAPPMGVVSDAMAIASSVDGVLVIAREGRVDLSQLENLSRNLDLVATPKLGFVVTGTRMHEPYRASGRGPASDVPETSTAAPVRIIRDRRSARLATTTPPWEKPLQKRGESEPKPKAHD
jgi:capsular exopolysaccharide synthesis family protein